MIYVDVDGVLADFVQYILSVEPSHSKEEFYVGVQEIMDKHYITCFRDSKKTKYFEYFYAMYQKEEVKLLTANGNHWSSQERKLIAYQNKIKWLVSNGFQEEDIIVVETSKDKLKYCKPGDILYDDKVSTVKEWNKLGGIGFIVPEL